MNQTFTQGRLPPASVRVNTGSSPQKPSQRKRLSLVQTVGHEKSERVKILVHERRQNRAKIAELEALINDLNDRLFLAERKSAVTANIGKR